MSSPESKHSLLEELEKKVAQSEASHNTSFSVVDKPEVRPLWESQWRVATTGVEGAEAWLDRLWEKHSEPTRHYHSSVHIFEMMSLFDLLQKNNYPPDLTTSDRQAIILAIFFHDAIYDAKGQTNEEQSASLFREFAEDVGLDSTLRATVEHFILATKNHKVSIHHSTALTCFLDLDMAVLGKEEQAYQHYAALIRKEYAFVPHDAYCEKRADILESFSQHASIYGLPVMQHALEKRARRNLRSEIAVLRQGLIPLNGRNPIS